MGFSHFADTARSIEPDKIFILILKLEQHVQRRRRLNTITSLIGWLVETVAVRLASDAPSMPVPLNWNRNPTFLLENSYSLSLR